MFRTGSQSNNYVYFDDFKVAHTKSNIIQSNEYYPFGLQTANSWTRDGSSNTFLANGGTELNTTSNLYDLEYRNYDPALARMHQVDPMADKYSSHTPYNFAFNRPNVLTDVDGADPYRSPYMNWHRDENHEGLGFVNWNSISEDMLGGYELGSLTTQYNPTRDAMQVEQGNMTVTQFASKYGEAINWWIVYGSSTSLGCTDAWLYFDRSYISDFKDRNSYFAAYEKGEGATYQHEVGAEYLKDYLKDGSELLKLPHLANYLLNNFCGDLQTKNKSLRFLVDAAQVEAGSAASVYGLVGNSIDFVVHPDLLNGAFGDWKYIRTAFAHEFQHVSDHDSGYSMYLWREFYNPADNIYDLIMERRAYDAGVQYATDQGWTNTALNHNTTFTTWYGIYPHSYEKYLYNYSSGYSGH